ncbi:MAG: adenylate/guanylate cyclase domain-containing protein [Cyanobacteria bacterium P01_C01_bin.70]
MAISAAWVDMLRPRRRPVFYNWTRRLTGIKYLGAIALLAIGYRLLILLIYQFPLTTELPTYPIWPPAAYSQLILLLLGIKFWPAVALGSLLNSLMTGQEPAFNMALAAANNSLQAMLGTALLMRFNFSTHFRKVRDVGLLVFGAAVIPSALSATIGTLNCCLQYAKNFEDIGPIWFNWWMGNVGAVLMLFPVVLTAAEWPRKFHSTQRKCFGMAWLLAMSALSWFIFAAPSRIAIFPVPLEYLPFPLIAWGALELGTSGSSMAILITTGFAGWGVIQGLGPFTYFSDQPGQAVLALQVYICVLVITALSLSASAAERDKAQRELRIEKEKSEQLLLNILPQPIAARLKQQQGTIADHFAEATVLFADIVDFTRLSTELPAQSLVDMLNEIFSTFDELAEKHRLEKIKTIGDAYMVVGGLPEHRQDHVEAIAHMAVDMQQAIVNFSQQQGRPFKIRIGINTGPVIAGVIGQKKFIYDLWGDTVNIASRMESTGVAGEIQVTQATYEVLKPHYQFICRGEIPVKGKGMMTTYLMGDRLSVPIKAVR